ncbi:MAG: hypothetical protein IJY85_10305 [Ruminococcus sp.]|nr:hypothetical protein [Ruminococcus sp.]
MRLFLIDYENVNSAGLDGISMLTQRDRVILFYSASANTISFDVYDELINSRVAFERLNLNSSGKNALDFQLVTYLGYLIAKQEAKEYYIISKDTGYCAALDFCKKQFGAKVQMKPSIKSAIAGKTPIPVKKKPVAVQRQPKSDTRMIGPEELLAQMDPPVPKDLAAEILSCMKESRTESEFHNALQHQIRSADTKRYYHHLKRYFKAIKAGK